MPRTTSLFASFALALALTTLTPSPASAQDAQYFKTPSGNITCAAFPDEEAGGAFGIECEIKDRDSDTPVLPRPADCDLEWGARFFVTVSKSGLSCYGDTLSHGMIAVLTYGSSLEFGSITCTSTEQGLQCKNAKGKGFFLSRAKQSLD